MTNSLHWKIPATFLQLNVPRSEIWPPFALIYFLWFAWLYSVLFFCVLLYYCYILSLFISTIYLTVILFIYLFIYCYHNCCFFVSATPKCKANLTYCEFYLFTFTCVCCTITGSFNRWHSWWWFLLLFLHFFLLITEM